VILLVVFLIGALFFVAGSLLVRRERLAKTTPAPMQTSVPAQPFERIDALLERGDAQSVLELERLRAGTNDPQVRDAADDALTVIRARG